jgi:hypothetical protein
MAKKAVLNPIHNTTNNIAAINTELNKVNDQFDNTISRDGSTPNSMNADLDMNSNDILNAQSIATIQLIVNGILWEGNLSYSGIWAMSTSYNSNEIVLSGSTLYIATVNHVSSGNIQTDISSGKMFIFLPPGEKGDTGDSGIIVSSTQPSNPDLNDLWLDIP